MQIPAAQTQLRGQETAPTGQGIQAPAAQTQLRGQETAPTGQGIQAPAAQAPRFERSDEDDVAAPVSHGRGRDDLSLSLPDRWRQAVEVVRRASPRQGASLAFARLLWIRPGEVAVGFTPAHGFHKATVVAASGKAAIEKCFLEHFGRPTVLKIETLPAAPAAAEAAAPGALSGPSIAEQEQEVRRRHEQETESIVRNHPAVRATLKLLGGEIEHVQVLEPEPKPVLSEAEGPVPGDVSEATAPEESA